MKKLFFLLFIGIGVTDLVYSQSDKVQELGIFTADFNGFGIRYKVGTNNLLYRFSVASLSMSSAEYDFGSVTQDEDDHGLALAGGFEIPVSMNDRFEVFYGGEASFQYEDGDMVNEDEISKMKFTGYGLNAVLGFSYSVSPKVKLSAEITPGLTFIKVKEGDLEVSGWKFQFNNQDAVITLGFRF